MIYILSLQSSMSMIQSLHRKKYDENKADRNISFDRPALS